MSTPGAKPEGPPPETVDQQPPTGAGATSNALVPETRAGSRGDYELLQEIGRGSVAVVYKARQVSLDRIVALKLIPPGQPHSTDEAVRQLRQEAEAAAGLDHPGIVRVFDIGLHDGWHYVAMAYVEGESLAKRLERGLLPNREAAQLIRDIAKAIHHCHQQGVIHRDLKPANILLDRDGSPKVTGFGEARRLDEEASPVGPGPYWLTPGYVAAEMAEAGPDSGPRTDVYGLGAILYALLTGRPPFQAATPAKTLRQVRRRHPVAPSRLNPKVSPDLETVCLKCLDKRPRWRYESAVKVAGEMVRWLNQRPIKARPGGRLRQGFLWCRRNPLTIAWVTVLLLMVVGSEAWRRGSAIAERREARATVGRPDAEPQQYARALQYFERAHLWDPHDYEIQLALGLARYRTGNYADARRTLRVFIENISRAPYFAERQAIGPFLGAGQLAWLMAGFRAGDLEELDRWRQRSGQEKVQVDSWNFTESELEYKRLQEHLQQEAETLFSDVTVLAHHLSDARPETRVLAAQALGKLGPKAAAAVPALVARLADDNPGVVQAATTALTSIDPDWLRKIVIANLTNLAPRSEPAWPPSLAAQQEVVKQLASEDPRVHEAALDYLHKLGPDAAPAVPDLIELFNHPDPSVRCRAVTALGNIGPRAESAIPDLLVLMVDISDPFTPIPKEQERIPNVGWALHQIDPNWQQSEAARRAIPDLIQRLSDPNPFVRASAADTLGALGPAASEAAPHLRELTHDPVQLNRGYWGKRGPGMWGPADNAREALNRIDPWWWYKWRLLPTVLGCVGIAGLVVAGPQLVRRLRARRRAPRET
jgi:serine/threonine protein kinase